jgi:ApaG protein
MRPEPTSRSWPYQAQTGDLVVRVRPSYLPDQSNPAERRWVWAYKVEIENRGARTVQLLSRHWIITDAVGRVEQVKGPGVVGEQPVLGPGEVYAYASGCPLSTSSGVMAGRYQMKLVGGGEMFEIEIPPFSLDLPEARRVVN